MFPTEMEEYCESPIFFIGIEKVDPGPQIIAAPVLNAVLAV